MKVIYVERNGRRYAYTSTSHRVPGRKNPVSDRVYLGIVDPVTGEIIPKKTSNPDQLRFSNGFSVKSHGDVVLVHAIAERLGIPDALEAVFGSASKELMAVVLAQAVRPSSPESVVLTMSLSGVCELLDLDPKDFDRRKVGEVMRRIDRGSVDRFIASRFPKEAGRMFVYCVRMSLTDEDSGFQLDVPEGSSRDRICVAVFVTDKGSIAGFRVIDDPIEDASDLIGLMHSLEDLPIPTTFASDPAYSSRMDFAPLLREGIDFIAGFSAGSDIFDRLMGQIDQDAVCSQSVNSRSRICLLETKVGVSLSGSVPEIIMPGESRFGGCNTHLGVRLMFDPQVAEWTKRRMKDVVTTVRLRLEGKHASDPAGALSITAGSLSDCFRIGSDRSGIMHVSVRRDRMSEFRRTAGMALIVSTSSDWDAIDAARSSRTLVDRAKDQFFGGSDWAHRYSGGNPGDMFPMMFIEYLVMMIYSEILRTASEAGVNSDVRDILLRASSLKKVFTPTGTYMGSSDRSLGRFLEKFDVREL